MDLQVVNIKNKIIVFSLITVLILHSVCYAKVNAFERQGFDHPDADTHKTYISEGVIIDDNSDGYKAVDPLNPAKPIGINEDEYKSVDNFNIDIKTLESRIKYFAPPYLSIKKNAESMLWMSVYARGGSINNPQGFRDSMREEYMTEADEYHDLLINEKRALDEYLKRPDATSAGADTYRTRISDYTVKYLTYKNTYQAAIKTVGMTTSKIGIKNALHSVAKVDDNNQIVYARGVVTKQLTSLVLTCMQLKDYLAVLDGQVELYKKMYEAYLLNYELGVSTSLEVSEKLKSYEDAKNSYSVLKTTYDNVREQVCINLGYGINDVDKLNFIEPEVDFDYIKSINIDDDREKAYNSNSIYKNISISSKDRKFPGSTGEELFKKRQQSAAEKVVVELENLYQNLQAAILSYNACEYLKEANVLNEKACERKKENNLLSDVEYLGLKIQNLANELEVTTAKYDLINATNDYYYGTVGQITVS